MNWQSLTFGANQPDALPLYAHMTMLAVDTLLYFLLAMYMDAIVPGIAASIPQYMLG